MRATGWRVAASSAPRAAMVGVVLVLAAAVVPAARAATPAVDATAHGAHATAAQVRGAAARRPSLAGDRDEHEKEPENPFLGPVAPKRGGIAGALAAPQQAAPNVPVDAPLLSFDGIDSGVATAAGVPDTNGEVGPDHFVQVVNRAYAIFDKQGNVVQDPAEEDGPFVGRASTDACRAQDRGDPVVAYDQLADRWVMTYFAFAVDANGPVAPYYECVAVSDGPDPTAGWCGYRFDLSPFFGTDFTDYPKLGITPNAYLVSFNVFGSTAVYGGAVALQRSTMLTCSTTKYVGRSLTGVKFGLLPADLDGSRAPAADAPGIFVGPDKSAWSLLLYRLGADWSTSPATSTLDGPVSISIGAPASNSTSVCPDTHNRCIPQPGTTVALDPLDRDQLMFRLAYRRFATYDSLVVDQTIDAGGNVAGIRWYEIRDPLGTPSLHQQGVLAPDSTHRWLGSVAQDKLGNMAMGFNVSSSSVYPGLRYVGRRPTDPLGQLPLGEGTLITGAGAKTAYNQESGGALGRARWGDYSDISVDPSDDCTFWFTGEYLKANVGAFDWQTRIGAFRLPGCAPAAAPDTTITSGPTGTVASTSASFSFSSTDNAATFECRLDAGAFAACTSPKAYTSLGQGAHDFSVRAVGAGGTDATPATRSWTVDTVAPDTTISGGPSGTVTLQDASFTFTASENGASFECRLDGAAFSACTSPKAYTNLPAGAHTFAVRARDGVGNVDASPAQRAWTITPAAPPETTIDSGPDGLVNSRDAQFMFSSDDPGATFQCQLDGVAFNACASPKTYSSLADGAHTFAVRAVGAGGTDATPATASWQVDATPPATSVTSAPPAVTSASSATFAFASSETGSQFRCRLDGGPLVSCSSPRTVSGLGDGAHAFEVTAVDAAGNADPTPEHRDWTVDTTPPETQLTGAPSGLVREPMANLSFTSSEPEAAFECSREGAAFAACTSPALLLLVDGAHTFAVRAVDRAGNADPTPAQAGWAIDATAPDTSVSGGPPADTTDTTATFTLAATETGTTFECRHDGGAFLACPARVTLSGLAVGDHVFEARASDAAGNQDATPATRSWHVRAAGGGVVAQSGLAALSAPATARWRTLAGRGLSVRVRCAAACGLSLRLTLPTKQARRLHLPRVVAQASAGRSAAGSVQLRLRLVAAARRAIRHGARTATGTLALTARPPGGGKPETTTTTLEVTR